MGESGGKERWVDWQDLEEMIIGGVVDMDVGMW